MNSDFVQQQAELLARRVSSEADNPARIQKAYQLIFGRAATSQEIQLGLDYLAAEPMREYDERKDLAQKKAGQKAESPAAEPEDTEKMADANDDAPAGGMMSGVLPANRAKTADKKKPPLPVTAWGRYAKILLSSSEFLFIN